MEGDNIVNVKVYSRYNGLLEYSKLNSEQATGDFGPSSNNTPYTTLAINLTKMEELIRTDHPQFSRFVNSSGYQYFSVACNGYGYQHNSATYKNTVNEFYQKYIFPSMTEESQKAMKEMFPQGTYVGYVLKIENDGWHLDGYFDAKYILEVYNENAGTTKAVQTETSDRPLNYSKVQEIVERECGANIEWNPIDFKTKSQTGYYESGGSKYEVTVNFGMGKNKTDVKERDWEIIYDVVDDKQESYLAQFVFHYEKTDKSIPDSVFIRVTKEFKKEDGTALTAAEINSLGGAETSFAITLGSEKLSLDNGAMIGGTANQYKWEVPDLGTSSYRITESGLTLEGHRVQATGNHIALTEGSGTGTLEGNVPIQQAEISVRLNEHNAVFPIKDIQMSTNPQEVNLIAGKLNSGEWIIWTSPKLSANERNKVISALQSYDTSKCFFYSGVDTLTAGITYGENTFWYRSGELDTDHPKNWSKMVSSSFTYKEVPEIQIVNTYTPVTVDFAVKKILKDGVNGKDKVSQVSFQLLKYNEKTEEYQAYGDAQAVNANNGTTTEGYVIFNDIPEGFYQLKELTTADGYQLLTNPMEIQVSNNQGSLTVKIKKENGSWEIFGEVESVEGKNIPVHTVYNTPGVELPETGGPGLIMMERFGWMLLLIALAGAEMQIFSRRRRKERE